MRRLFLLWLINAGAIFLTAKFLPGFLLTDFKTALIVSLVLGLVNMVIKPIVVLLSLPFILLTLGLFMLVINAGFLYFASQFVNGFIVDGFWTAMLGSMCISVISSVGNWLVGDGNE